MRISRSVLLLVASVTWIGPARTEGQLGSADVFGHLEAESRLYSSRPLSSEQPRWHSLSLASEVRYEQVLGDRVALRATLFGRVDESDPQRSHVDVREALVQITGDVFAADLGVNTVFWGVTESRHLVNIVNQPDYLEDLSGDDRFGQLMVRLSYDTGPYGFYEVFVMTWSRPQPYPGRKGRPGVPLPVLDESPRYESGSEEWHADVALRWSHSVSEIDWAVSYFRGTSREPELVPVERSGESAIEPFYAIVNQAGLEVQWTRGSWLWKLEGAIREGQGDTFAATTFGFEHTSSSVFGSLIDLGALLEYSYDGRDNLTLNSYDNDLFGGLRISLNDVAGTEILAGTITDLETGTFMGTIEASRRLNDRWTLDLRARVFSSDDDEDPLYWFRRDHYLQTTVEFLF